MRIDDNRQVLRIEWLEKGGPSVAEPDQRGFGTKLIEGSIAAELGGKALLSFAPEGLRCEFVVPPESVVSDLHQGAGEDLA